MTMELRKPRSGMGREGDAPSVAASTYDADFFRWTQEQARLLRDGRLADLDMTNLAEEIETLGRSELRSLRSAIRNVLLHMLKWDHQPSRRSTSWVHSIRNARDQVMLELRDSPSLKAKLDQAILDAYSDARNGAARQMRVDEDRLPATCPYTASDIFERPFTIDRKRPNRRHGL